MIGQGKLPGYGGIEYAREWGTTPQVPSEDAARALLEQAHTLGIRVFDTAASYGPNGERILGDFLRSLTAKERSEVDVLTKFAEYWGTEGAYVDYTYDRFQRDFELRLQHLGGIAVLQVHKTTPAVFGSEDINRCLELARSAGVSRFGVSISGGDVLSAEMALGDTRFDFMQLPYNQTDTRFQLQVRAAAENSKHLIINRPLQMGKLAVGQTVAEQEAAIAAAYTHILKEDFTGAVLLGTANPNHLADDIRLFEVAQRGLLAGG